MKIRVNNHTSVRARAKQAMTLVEVMIAVAGVGILLVTLYVGITQGFAVIQTARENLRATQVLQEKMETMRVYNWEQITDGGFIPRTFREPFYAVSDENNGGFDYFGTLRIVDASPLLGSVSYINDLRWVIVEVQWQSGNVTRRREMRTLVSHFGLHSYVY